MARRAASNCNARSAAQDSGHALLHGCLKVELGVDDVNVMDAASSPAGCLEVYAREVRAVGPEHACVHRDVEYPTAHLGPRPSAIIIMSYRIKRIYNSYS